MKDLTQGSIARHILTLSGPVLAGMLAQIAYQLIDLYFITKAGVAATAGVNAAGNVVYIIYGLTQVLGVGTAALIAHAVGTKSRDEANLVFNQSLTLTAIVATGSIALIAALLRPYMRAIAADEATVAAGTAFMLAVLPGFALMFLTTTLGAALRGTGVIQVPIYIYMLTVAINAVLAPVLISGWGSGVALGAQGAGLATSLSVAAGAVILALYFRYRERYLALRSELMRPRMEMWRRILGIGVPSGVEVGLTFCSGAVVYFAIRDFGAEAQAGFGIGSRVLQAVLLPGLSIAYAAGPIAGQNFGARDAARVRHTFRMAALLSGIVMLAVMLLIQLHPDTLVRFFDADESVTSMASTFLQLLSWTLIAQGLVYTCSTLFQSLGNTLPSLISSGTRFVVFSVPAIWLSTRSEFTLHQVWHLMAGSILLQAAVSLLLLQREMRRRLEDGH